jgi:hypothetical protein
MARVNPFAGFFKMPAFIKLMNAQYYPAATMQASVQRLIKSQGPEFVKNIKYGEYQSVLAPYEQWPPELAKAWPKSMREARDDLARQVNGLAVSAIDSSVPGDKCALLDKIVNYCFNATLPGERYPGIPMVIDVQQKTSVEPGNDRHDIHVSWTYDANDVPIQLNWTMVCPFS